MTAHDRRRASPIHRRPGLSGGDASTRRTGPMGLHDDAHRRRRHRGPARPADPSCGDGEELDPRAGSAHGPGGRAGARPGRGPRHASRRRPHRRPGPSGGRRSGPPCGGAPRRPAHGLRAPCPDLDHTPELELRFVPDAVEAEQAVLSGSASAAYLLPPTKVDRVWTLVEAGQKLPQKSTYFWPKPRTGLVIRPLEPGPS